MGMIAVRAQSNPTLAKQSPTTFDGPESGEPASVRFGSIADISDGSNLLASLSVRFPYDYRRASAKSLIRLVELTGILALTSAVSHALRFGREVFQRQRLHRAVAYGSLVDL